MQNIILTFLAFAIYMQSVCYARGGSRTQTASMIVNGLKNLRSSFQVKLDDRNFGEDEDYNQFKSESLRAGNANSVKIAKLYADAIEYINKNKKIPRVRKSKEFAQIVNIANKLRNFKNLNAKLNDDGCLANQSSRVRDLANATLLGALTSPIPGCLGGAELDQAIDNLFIDTKHIKACVEFPEYCDADVDVTQGLFGVPFKNKEKLAKQFLGLKKRNDLINKNFVNMAFGGDCKLGKRRCSQIKRAFPKEYQFPPKENTIGSITRSLLDVNKELREDRKKIIDQALDENGRKKFIPTSRLDEHIERFTLRADTNETEESLFESLSGEVPEDLEDLRGEVALSIPKRLEQRKKVISKTPIAFATKNAVKTCAPRFYEMVYTDITISRVGGNLQLNIPKEDAINRKQIECIRETTIRDVNTKHGVTTEDYNEKLKETSNLIKRGHENKERKQKITRGQTSRNLGDGTAQFEQANEKMDDLIGDMIVGDPVTFGALLVEKNQDYGIETICSTLAILGDKQAKEDEESSKKFQSLSISALALAGAGLVFGNVIGLAFAAGATGLSGYEAHLYHKKRSKFLKSARNQDVNGTFISASLDSKESALELMQDSAKKYAKNMTLAEQNSFFSMVNVFTGGLGLTGLGASTAVAIEMKHLPKISDGILSDLSLKVLAGSAKTMTKVTADTGLTALEKATQKYTGIVQKIMAKHHGHHGHSKAHVIHEAVEFAETYAKAGEVALTTSLTLKYGAAGEEAARQLVGVLSASTFQADEVEESFSAELDSLVAKEDVLTAEALIRDVTR